MLTASALLAAAVATCHPLTDPEGSPPPRPQDARIGPLVLMDTPSPSNGACGGAAWRTHRARVPLGRS